ncbi:MAG: fructosamine kinase family protein [Nocardioides sp.]|uniref:fructosamine kinase family protein n=1 Tax=Nocardioides sp. TaxID=35761 RepID=UPI0039E4CE60
MPRQPLVSRRAEQLLGRVVVSTAPVPGGNIATATKLRLGDGSQALMKTLSHAPADFFPTEARGLRWLAEADPGLVPDVLAAEQDCLIIGWVDVGRPTSESAEALGKALAGLHRRGADRFGATADGYIGRLPLPNRPTPTWAEFYAVRRVLPYLKLAVDRGAVEPDEAAAIESVIGRLTALLPEEPPARLHGDLWNGNVLWDATGGARLIDPAAYGGHRELDLAMLALFGLPHLDRVIDSYQEVTPLAEGWADRVALHQLFPLLAHAAMFGGGYGARAAAAAARYR